MQEERNEQTPQAGWQFTNEDAGAGVPQPSASAHQDPINWTASEYVSHSKSSLWYIKLAFVAAVASGLCYLVTRDWVVVATLVVVAIIFGVAAGRKPRVLNYGLDSRGIQIGQKIYPYGMFKSFSVVQEGPIRSIFLLPVKRFNPPLSLYYPPEGEQVIVQTIGSHLPQEAREQDAIDRFMHTIRF